MSVCLTYSSPPIINKLIPGYLRSDPFLQIFSDFDGFVPIWEGNGRTSVHPTDRPTASQPSSAVLTVPIDCDPNLWDAFVNSNMWDSRVPQGDTSSEAPFLLEYYVQIASTTVVVRDGASEFNLVVLIVHKLIVSYLHLRHFGQVILSTPGFLSIRRRSHVPHACHSLRRRLPHVQPRSST